MGVRGGVSLSACRLLCGEPSSLNQYALSWTTSVIALQSRIGLLYSPFIFVCTITITAYFCAFMCLYYYSWITFSYEYIVSVMHYRWIHILFR